MAYAYPSSYSRRNGVNGSLAYELDYIGGSVAPAPKRPQEKPTAPPVRKEAHRNRTRARTRTQQVRGISISTLLCFVGTLALVLTLLGNYVQMIELSEEASALKSEMETLQKENNALRVQHESEIDLKEIERYATEELGMVMPGADSVVYFDLSEPDRAVVGDETELPVMPTEETARSAAERLLEYFR